MQIKAIIFDLDGVITDTAHFHFQAWSQIAKTFNYSLTPKDNEGIKGLSRRDSLLVVMEMAGIQRSEDEISALLLEKNEIYQELLQGLGQEDTLPGFREFLADCKQHQIPVSVGSASKNAKIILEKLGLTNEFVTIVDGHMVTHSKPDPEVFQKAAAAMNVEPSETVVFEDAIAGVKAANAGGFFSVGIGEEHHLSHAKHVIPSMLDFSVLDLLQIVKS